MENGSGIAKREGALTNAYSNQLWIDYPQVFCAWKIWQKAYRPSWPGGAISAPDTQNEGCG